MIFQLFQRKAFPAKPYHGKELHDVSRSRQILSTSTCGGGEGSEEKEAFILFRHFKSFFFFITFLEIN